MRKVKIQFHALLRVVGSVCLTLGVFFSVFGTFERTFSTIFLWGALLMGLLSLVFAYVRGRSWYSGIIIFGATYFFLMTRSSANNILGVTSVAVALSSALYGVFLDPYTKGFKRKLFK